jgi:hypothetical protein
VVLQQLEVAPNALAVARKPYIDFTITTIKETALT